jgi:hypothetical protein
MGAMALGVQGTFHGSYHRLEDPGAEHPVTLAITASVADARRFLRERRADVAGTIDAEGLAARRPVEGAVWIRALEGKLMYQLRFVADDGRDHRAAGETELDPRRPLRALSELALRVRVDDREVARMLLRLPPPPELSAMFRKLTRFGT